MKTIISGLLLVSTLSAMGWCDILAAARSSPGKKIVRKMATAVVARGPIARSTTAAANALDDVVLSEALAPAVNAPSPFSGEGRVPPGVRVPSSGLRPPSPASPREKAGQDLPSPAISAGEGGRSPGEGSAGTPPSLHGLVGQWLTGSSPSLDARLAGGLAMFRVGGRTDAAATVAVRVAAQGSELRAQRWGFELGSILPHGVSGGFDAVSQTQGAAVYNARLASYYEIHAAAVHALPHGSQEWVVPEVGLGVSFLQAVNAIRSLTTYQGSYLSGGQTVTYTYQVPRTTTDRRWSVSPLFRVGVVLCPGSLVSARLDAAYVGYANTATAAGQTFDLGFSGMMWRAAVQVRL